MSFEDLIRDNEATTKQYAEGFQPTLEPDSFDEDIQLHISGRLDEVPIVHTSEVKFEVTVQLDMVPGKFHQPEDFIELIQSTIPDWYLKSVRQIGG